MNVTPLEFAALYALGVALVFGLLRLARWRAERKP